LDILSEEQREPRGPRWGRGLQVIGVLVAIAAAAWILARREAPPTTRSSVPAPARSRAPSPRATPGTAGTGVVEISAPDGATVSVDGRRLGSGSQRVELEPGAHDVRVEQPGHDAFLREVQVIPGRTVRLEARLESESPVLQVHADVPGAQLFVDRKFVGQAPVTVHDLLPGRHQVNASAEGYEGQSRTVDVEPGPNEVTIRFKEVRLDESLAVTHKHGLGSCRGRLVASTNGLSYESDNARDSFSLPFRKLEPLEVDYLRKNLRVKERGGRTYNFTADGADELLVFQKTVEKARNRLADGG